MALPATYGGVVAVQYTRTSASTMPARTTWAGADVQLYTKGRGWGRDAVSGALTVVFDPKRAQTKELSYTSAQIAFPGMPATPPQPSHYYEMCVLVEPLDHEGALVDVFVPGYASGYAAEYEKQLPLPRSYIVCPYKLRYGEVWGCFSSAGWRIPTPLEEMFYGSFFTPRS